MWRVLEIAGDGYFLHVRNKNVLVEKEGRPPLPISFSDLHSVICHGQNISFSDSFFEGCLRNEIPITFCDEKHLPLGMLLPFYQHTDGLQRIQKQINAKLPKKKQAWRLIIKSKISAQAGVLSFFEKESSIVLKAMADHVLSGDSTNLEAQAARVYFESLFGEDFVRSDDDCEINTILNYGYSIIRSTVARAVSSCGLHPSFGVFHSGRTNPFCLVDDLMEPLRPIVDRKVFDLYQCEKSIELNPYIKKNLIGLTTEPVKFGPLSMELPIAVRKYVMEYLSFISGERSDISFPKMKD